MFRTSDRSIFLIVIFRDIAHVLPISGLNIHIYLVSLPKASHDSLTDIEILEAYDHRNPCLIVEFEILSQQVMSLFRILTHKYESICC